MVVHDLENVAHDNPFVAKELQGALGKCIHEQNEKFKKSSAEEKNKKFAEIMFTESNLLNIGGVFEDMTMRVEDHELDDIALGRVSPDAIMTPKLAMIRSRKYFESPAEGEEPQNSEEHIFRRMFASTPKIFPGDYGEGIEERRGDDVTTTGEEENIKLGWEGERVFPDEEALEREIEQDGNAGMEQVAGTGGTERGGSEREEVVEPLFNESDERNDADDMGRAEERDESESEVVETLFNNESDGRKGNSDASIAAAAGASSTKAEG